MWKTLVHLNHNNGVSKSDVLRIKRGISQGDFHSPLLFCMTLVPLSNELYKSEYGCRSFNRVICHLFYMDHLKIFAKNDQELEGLLLRAFAMILEWNLASTDVLRQRLFEADFKIHHLSPFI